MIKFTSPLPRNYDQIVKLFCEGDPIADAKKDKEMKVEIEHMMKYCDDPFPPGATVEVCKIETPITEAPKVIITEAPKVDPPTPKIETSIKNSVSETSKIVIAETPKIEPPILIETPIILIEPPILIETPIQPTVTEEPISTTSTPQIPPPSSEWTLTQPIPKITGSEFNVSINMDKVQPTTKTKTNGKTKLSMSAVPVNPFTEKPKVVTPTLNQSQLLEANPTLNDEYLQQREVLLQARELQSSTIASDLKLSDVKVDIPQEYLDQQKKMFDEQQAALRMLRDSNQTNKGGLRDSNYANVLSSDPTQPTPIEKKIDVETEQPLPPPNSKEPMKKITINRTKNLLPESKQINELQQALPPANMVQLVESLRVDQLKQLCVQRGLGVKGNKPDLIARLKGVGIHSVTY